jgi:hypothetical protein
MKFGSKIGRRIDLFAVAEAVKWSPPYNLMSIYLHTLLVFLLFVKQVEALPYKLPREGGG